MMTALQGLGGPARHFKPVARVVPDPLRDLDAGERLASIIAKRNASIQCALESPAWASMYYANRADFTALSSFTSEASLLQGQNQQPYIPAGFFDGPRGFGRTLTFQASGVFSTTGTPTYTFQTRLSTTVGATTLSGSSIGVSAAITTGSGVTDKMWTLELNLTCNTPGQGTGNTTLNAFGWVRSGGFAAPYEYPLEVTTPDTATWTQTLDATLTYYFNLSVTCSASSASNAIRCKSLRAFSWN